MLDSKSSFIVTSNSGTIHLLQGLPVAFSNAFHSPFYFLSSSSTALVHLNLEISLSFWSDAKCACTCGRPSTLDQEQLLQHTEPIDGLSNGPESLNVQRFLATQLIADCNPLMHCFLTSCLAPGLPALRNPIKVSTVSKWRMSVLISTTGILFNVNVLNAYLPCSDVTRSSVWSGLRQVNPYMSRLAHQNPKTRSFFFSKRFLIWWLLYVAA